MSDDKQPPSRTTARDAANTPAKAEAPSRVPIIFTRDTGNNVAGDISAKPEDAVRNEEAKGERATFRRLTEAERAARGLK